MQLPDAAFGRRWPVGLAYVFTGAEAEFDISEAALPERFVIWEVLSNVIGTFNGDCTHTLALGSKLPTSDAQFNGLELLFGGIISKDGFRGAFTTISLAQQGFSRLRQPVISSGRRLVGRAIRDAGAPAGGTISIIISSLPTDVPGFYKGYPEEKLDRIIQLMELGVKPFN